MDFGFTTTNVQLQDVEPQVEEKVIVQQFQPAPTEEEQQAQMPEFSHVPSQGFQPQPAQPSGLPQEPNFLFNDQELFPHDIDQQPTLTEAQMSLPPLTALPQQSQIQIEPTEETGQEDNELFNDLESLGSNNDFFEI